MGLGVQIAFPSGHVVTIDHEDIDLFAAYRWHVDSVGRKRGKPYLRRSPDKAYWHRVVLGAQRGEQIDHVNGDSLDNRRSNLRFCSQSENNQNWTGSRRNTSGYKGVSWDRWTGRWVVRIQVDGKQLNLGRFDDREQAARAYDAAAREHWGDFARTNFDA